MNERNTNSIRKQSAYEKVLLIRRKGRPHLEDFLNALFTDFVELKGDRCSGEDAAVMGGIAAFHGMPVTVIGHRKGKTTAENMQCNFGMASPAGYRKALRLMRQAERFGRPVITLIDTPGAYPGMEAEAGGQANAIAENLAAMSSLQVPLIAVITGEGNSGGALALAVSDYVFMLENAVYSILSPEGFASILWKDAGRAGEAAEVMKLTAQDLYGFGLIDRVIPEKNLYKGLDSILSSTLKKLTKTDTQTLLKRRYQKYRMTDGLYRPQKKEQSIKHTAEEWKCQELQ